MITIDGSEGEGGGQIVRTSLALSVLTGQPIQLENIRAGRRKPGLLRQHLTGLRAAAEISNATVEGDTLRSECVRFEPGAVRAGDYAWAIGSAGSANLVLQTVLPPLFAADGPSSIVLEGGTHNPKSPPFHFLQKSFLPLLTGPTVDLTLDRWGFYPAGGGQFTAHIQPGMPEALELLDERFELSATALVANLPHSVGQREMAVLQKKLRLPDERCQVLQVESRGPGNVVWVEAKGARFSALFTAFGEKGRSAERVASKLADEVARWQASGAPVDEHLADQLLIPLAMGAGGSFRTVAPSLHTLTNMRVIERFLPVRFSADESHGSWVLTVTRR